MYLERDDADDEREEEQAAELCALSALVELYRVSEYHTGVPCRAVLYRGGDRRYLPFDLQLVECIRTCINLLSSM